MLNYQFSKFVKETLLSSINNLELRKDQFVRDAAKDFTRNRSLPFGKMIKTILSFGGGSLSTELTDLFYEDQIFVSNSAFVQRRHKILPQAFSTLFKEFTFAFDDYKLFNGYRVLAVDGTDLHIPHNPKETDSYFQSLPNTKGFNLMHINAMYDLINKVYLDLCNQPGREKYEQKALVDMTDESTLLGKVLLIADRGYESYNVFAHLINKDWKFLIRVKDTKSKSILSSFDLPPSGEFDVNIHRILTRKRPKLVKTQPHIYKMLSNDSTFDYVDEERPYYPMSLRTLRVQLDDGSYQCFITNLDADEFSLNAIKDLYYMRWGIETSFNSLKNVLGLTHLHSKKAESIVQEVYAKVIMFNFCSIITSHVMIKEKRKKHVHQHNFSVAIKICRDFFSKNNASIDIEALIQKFTLPIRKGRSSPRKVKQRTFVSFNNRLS